MLSLRHHHRPLTWLALVAMLALALLPALSHALSFQRGASGHWVEVCTPQGMRLVAVDGAADPAAQQAPLQAIGHLEHCPFCTLQGGHAAPPPAPLVMALPPALGAAAPPLFLHAPRTLFAWRSAQPRGPPSFS